jgi:hypothetical protein
METNETSSAFTLGPWRVGTRNYATNRAYVWTDREYPKGAFIAEVSGEYMDAVEPNARLIAQSPAMFDLVLAYRQECSDQIQQCRDDLKENFGDADDVLEMLDYWKERRSQCDSVLAKVYGKAA